MCRAPPVLMPMTRFRAVVGNVFRYVLSVFAVLVGRWQWQPPPWAAFSAAQTARGWRYLFAKPVRAIMVLVTVLAATSAVAWYAKRPRPHYVTYTVTFPGLTEYNDKGIA